MVGEKKNEELAQIVIDRHNKLYEIQSSFRSNWQELADYIHPTRSNIVSFREPGAKQTNEMLDSTAIHSNELLAASMNGALTSPNLKWFRLKVRNVRETKAIREWLDDCADRMHVALQQSNFNAEVHECYLDLGAFGTCGLEIMERPIVVPGFNGLQFKSYSVGEYVVDENIHGIVDTVIKKSLPTARAAANEFGDSLNEDLLKLAIDKPEEEVEILHAIVPAYDMKKVLRGLPNFFEYASIYVDVKYKDIIKLGGFRENPVPVARWSKTSGETYGRGPGFTALPDVKTLNKLVELELQALALSNRPPVEVLDDGIIGTVRLTPAGITYVRKEKSVNPLRLGGDFRPTQLKTEQLQASIRRIFFSDQLQFQETPQMTATEVYVRYELMQRLLGPTLGRLQSELFNRSIERIFGLMYRAGAFLPPPPELLKRGKIDIEYEGPMARAQRSGEAVGIMRTLQAAALLAEAKGPRVFDRFNDDKIMPVLAEINGMPSNLLYDDDEVDKIRKEREKQEAEMQMRQDVRDAAEAGKGIAPLIKATQGQQGKVE